MSITSRIITAVVFALCVSFPASVLAAQDPSTWSRDQIAAALAQGTGMTKDGVGLALGDSPKAMDRATDALVGVQVIAQLSEAKDEDAAATAVDWAVSKVKDKLVTGPAATALTAVSLYKASLDAIHDYAYMPAMDERIYAAYRAQRMADSRSGQLSPSPESSETAFSVATEKSLSGYQVVRDRVYKEMLKRRNLAPEMIGKRFEDFLRGQIDMYWQARMETRMQREYLRENRDRLIAQAWEQARKDLAAAKPKLPAGLGADPDAEAALAAWKADFEAEINSRGGDKGQYTYTEQLEWVTAPYIKNGSVVGRHQIWATYVYYAGEHKGRTIKQTVNSFFIGNPEPGVYTSVSEIKRKYANKKGAAQRPATSPPAPQPGTAESTTKSLDDTKKSLKELGDSLKNIFK